MLETESQATLATNPNYGERIVCAPMPAATVHCTLPVARTPASKGSTFSQESDPGKINYS